MLYHQRLSSLVSISSGTCCRSSTLCIPHEEVPCRQPGGALMQHLRQACSPQATQPILLDFVLHAIGTHFPLRVKVARLWLTLGLPQRKRMPSIRRRPRPRGRKSTLPICSAHCNTHSPLQCRRIPDSGRTRSNRDTIDSGPSPSTPRPNSSTRQPCCSQPCCERATAAAARSESGMRPPAASPLVAAYAPCAVSSRSISRHSKN